MDQSDEEQQGRGFKVADRRRFTGESEATARVSEGESPQGPDSPPAGTEERPVDDAIAMSFSTFIISLSTQALMHLGEIADPIGQEVRQDLPAARQMIDLLGILSDKTKGNLDAAEEQLLTSMLYDLRMRYVEVSRRR